jgi:hypothetical protein
VVTLALEDVVHATLKGVVTSADFDICNEMGTLKDVVTIRTLEDAPKSEGPKSVVHCSVSVPVVYVWQ